MVLPVFRNISFVIKINSIEVSYYNTVIERYFLFCNKLILKILLPETKIYTGNIKQTLTI